MAIKQRQHMCILKKKRENDIWQQITSLNALFTIYTKGEKGVSYKLHSRNVRCTCTALAQWEISLNDQY